MNILVTAIGSFSADCIINTLKRTGNKVVGCDIYPPFWHAVTKDCDIVYQAPYAVKEKEYIEFLLQISRKEQIEYIIPLTDIEIDVLNNNRDIFVERGLILCMPSSSTLSIARNKEKICLLFEHDMLVNIPKFVNAKQLDSTFPLPAIAKPLNGRSSEGLMYIESMRGLEQLIGLDNYIVQQRINGSVYTVDYVRDKDGHDFSIPREELLRTKNGAGTTVKIEPNQDLINMVSYVGNTIDSVGCINMEFIKGEDGKFYLIDINPRFSAGVAFSNFVGYDMVTSNINCFNGKSILRPIAIKEQIIAKRYHEELL